MLDAFTCKKSKFQFALLISPEIEQEYQRMFDSGL
jgi:hypothetical protein